MAVVVGFVVKLIKDGQPFKMSKRKGDYITVEDLISEVGKDATRFIMLNRSNDVELDFDFTKVKEKSKDNPLYYVQYCYARISSVFRNLNKNINDEININNFDLNYTEDEIKILSDAQTSGGLLISLPSEVNVNLEEVKKDYKIDVWEIGEINSKYNEKINII